MVAGKSGGVARRHLDKRFFAVSSNSIIQRLARPQKGWIRAIRDALGMSSAQLAKRVGVSQPALFEVEVSEAAGTVKLQTLKRVATALNCSLVYALIPNEPLEEMVRKRALDVVDRHLGAIEHTMRLENQAVVDDSARRQERETLLADIDWRRLWD